MKFTSCPYSLLYYFLRGILEFWCLATVKFKFTVFYNNIYRKKKILHDEKYLKIVVKGVRSTP